MFDQRNKAKQERIKKYLTALVFIRPVATMDESITNCIFSHTDGGILAFETHDSITYAFFSCKHNTENKSELFHNHKWLYTFTKP